MKILTVDTSTDKMYITLSIDNQVCSDRIIESTKERYHTALLIPTIIEILKDHNLTMQSIDAIGVNVGPGSFTGIRASATVTRIMGQNLDIPVVGVPSLEIISLINDTDKNSLCLLDARKGKAYMGIYGANGDVIEQPQALEYEKVTELARNNDFFIIADKTMHNILAENRLNSVNIQETNYDFGIYLAKLTYRHLKQDNTEQYTWYNLKPLYIQPPPISMPKTA